MGSGDFICGNKSNTRKKNKPICFETFQITFILNKCEDVININYLLNSLWEKKTLNRNRLKISYQRNVKIINFIESTDYTPAAHSF